MNILFCTVGRRGYIVDYFRKHLFSDSKLIGTSDRNDSDTEFTSGFFHCDKSYIVPSIKEERKYIDELLHICKTEKIDMLLSFYDYDTYILSKYLKEFELIGVKPVISSHQVNIICFDKVETFKFLKREGFGTPWTMTSEEVTQTDIPSYPVIVKPRFGFGSNAISLAHDRSEVDFFLKYYDNEDMIVQEFIEGTEYSFDILNDFNGEMVTTVVKQKMKMRSGETDQGYALKDSKLAEVGMKLGEKLEHVGPLDVDFFIKEGKPYILELNPRFGGGYPITYLAGVDFPKILIDMLNGDLNSSDYEKYHDYQEGIMMIKDMSILKTSATDENICSSS